MRNKAQGGEDGYLGESDDDSQPQWGCGMVLFRGVGHKPFRVVSDWALPRGARSSATMGFVQITLGFSARHRAQATGKEQRACRAFVARDGLCHRCCSGVMLVFRQRCPAMKWTCFKNSLCKR